MPRAATDACLMSNVLQEFELTPAECRVAEAIANGVSLNAFARQNGLSVHTVRNQLKTVFAKTGVSRQLELALLIHNSRK